MRWLTYDSCNSGNIEKCGDTLVGGNGLDVITTTGAVSGVRMDLSLYSGIEKVIGTAYSDTVLGSTDSEFIDGGAGSDYLAGGYGADTIYGGDGSDTIIYDAEDDVSGGTGFDIVTATAWGQWVIMDGSYCPDIEGFIGSKFGDIVRGNSLNNMLDGGDGDDYLEGGQGNDTIYGGNGDDAIVYDKADVLRGGAGFDVLTAEQSEKGVVINCASYLDIEGFIGSRYNDTLLGSSLANYIDGGAGNDYLNGGIGSDFIYSGDGDDTIVYDASDTIYGGAGIDVLVSEVTKRAVIDLVNYSDIENIVGSNISDLLSGSWLDNIIRGGLGNDRINGRNGADILDGGDGRDYLYGGDGDDTLVGGNGNDRLYAGSGADSLVGGAGTDIYYYEQSAQSHIVRINNASGGVKDIVRFGEGIDYSNIQATVSGSDLYLQIPGAAENKLIIENWVTNTANRVNIFKFFDGSVKNINYNTTTNQVSFVDAPINTYFSIRPIFLENTGLTDQMKSVINSAVDWWEDALGDEYGRFTVDYIKSADTLLGNVPVASHDDDMQIIFRGLPMTFGIAGSVNGTLTDNNNTSDPLVYKSRAAETIINTNYNFFLDASNNPDVQVANEQYDLFTIILHEIEHNLGFSYDVGAFKSHCTNGHQVIDKQTGLLAAEYSFNGSNAKSVYGNNVPVFRYSGGAHLDNNRGEQLVLCYNTDEVLMHANSHPGLRTLPTDLDLAVLQDVGHVVL